MAFRLFVVIGLIGRIEKQEQLIEKKKEFKLIFYIFKQGMVFSDGTCETCRYQRGMGRIKKRIITYENSYDKDAV